MVRRDLGFSRSEWDALHEFDRRMYLEGMVEDIQARTPDEEESEDDGEPSLGAISAAGAQVRRRD